MSLKAELEIWAAALAAYDADDLEGALEQFGAIADTSKILTNIGLIHATLGEHEIAVEQFKAATELDKYLAIAHFQAGVSNFLLGRYENALIDFENAYLYLRGNQFINYEQLGLKFKLWSAEVSFNKGLALIYMGQMNEGMAELELARSEKQTEEHSVIDEAIQDKGDGYTVFSIPVGILYRPAESKLKNAKTKDYMGKAKLVAAADSTDAYTTFTGVTRLRNGVSPSGVFVDRPENGRTGLSRSVTSPSSARRPNFDSPAVAAAALARSKTTIGVSGDARDRLAGLTSPTAAATPSPPASAGVARSATSAGMASKPLGRSLSIGGPALGAPVRGLSVRKNDAGATPVASPAPASAKPAVVDAPSPIQEQPEGEFYDDYLDAYHEEDEQGREKIAAWAEQAVVGPAPTPRAKAATASPATSRPSSVYSTTSSGSMRRKPTRRARKPAMSSFDEEEEGYGSGDYDEEPLALTKVRVKIHYSDDIRGMALNPETPFEDFVDMVCHKFGLNIEHVGLKFTDEDGGKISLRDESDYEMAIETAREHAQGKAEGKLEIWAVDI